MTRVVLCVLLFSTAAQSQEGELRLGGADGVEVKVDAVMHEAARQYGIDLDPMVEPEGQGVVIRPLDDSDPEMRQQVVAYYETVPCRDQNSPFRCERALKIMRDGGDRLAHYLIRQIEENDKEGWPDQGSYTVILGLTESPVAYDYLRHRAFNLTDQWLTVGAPNEVSTKLRATLASLADTKAQPALEDALVLIDRFDGHPEMENHVLDIIEKVQKKHGLPPHAEQKLRAVHERQQASGKDYVGEEEMDGLTPVERILTHPNK
jgi:hypothetical protein